MSALTRSSASDSSTSRRVAAASLGVWGLIHVLGGLTMVVGAWSDAGSALGQVATALGPVAVRGDVAAAASGVVGFLGFGILVAGAVVAVGAWQSRSGPVDRLTLPLGVAAVADLGLVVFLLLPGVMTPLDALPGLLLLAVAFLAALWSGWRPQTGRGRE